MPTPPEAWRLVALPCPARPPHRRRRALAASVLLLSTWTLASLGLPGRAEADGPTALADPALHYGHRPRVSPSVLDTSDLALSVHYALTARDRDRADRALGAFGYGEAPRSSSGRFAVTARVARFLFLGGQLGVTRRRWLDPDDRAVEASAVDALFVATLRAPLHRALDVGAKLALGLGVGGLSMGDAASYSVIPRVEAAVIGGVTLLDMVRAVVELGGTYLDLPGDGVTDPSSLSLGGLYVAFGLEVRP